MSCSDRSAIHRSLRQSALSGRRSSPSAYNLSTVTPPPSELAQNDVTVSIARRTLFVIGKRSGQVSLARRKKPLPSIGGVGIFGSFVAIAGEDQRLVRNHTDFADHGIGGERDLYQHGIDLLRRRFLVRSSADNKEARAHC